jgi:molybdopterin-guanine dinucleotide biosynthesis protein A
MGLAKHGLPFGNQTLLEHIVGRLQLVADTVVVVAAVDQELTLPHDVRVVRDTRPDLGPLEGLATGLESLSDEADCVFVTSCDVPLLVPQFARRMFDLIGDPYDGYEIVAVDDGQQQHPLSAVYRVSVAAKARRQLLGTDRSLKSLLRACRTRFVSPDLVDGVDPRLNSLRNVNSLNEYRQATTAAGFDVRL